MRQFITTIFADGLSADERNTIKFDLAKEGWTDITIKSRKQSSGQTAFEFWGQR